MKAQIALVTLMFAATAQADYTPDAAGWWQLQYADSPYTEVCNSGDAVCSPDDGEYKLLDFITYPPIETAVTIGSPPPVESGIVKIDKLCQFDPSKPATQCNIQCPVGKTVVGVLEYTADSRAEVYLDDSDGNEITLLGLAPTAFLSTRTGVVCQSLSQDYGLTMKVAVACE